MKVRKFAIGDASFDRSPGQDGDIFAGNVVSQQATGFFEQRLTTARLRWLGRFGH